MSERLRRGSGSGEPKDATVTSISDVRHERKFNEIMRPGLSPKLQRALEEQNGDGQMAYHDALSEQRGDPPTRADGWPLRLGLVDPETGLIIEPPGETDDDIDDQGPPDSYTPPPPPTSAA